MKDGKGGEAVTSLVDGDRAPRTEAPSVLLACIGDAFMPGVKEAAFAAVEAYGAVTHGAYELFLLPNLTVIPPLGLGAMRNFMVRRAHLLGYDYLMLLDNDVVLSPDTITRLVAHGKPYITPWYDQTPFVGNDKFVIVNDPMYQAKQGLRVLKWTVPYCNLIRRDLFSVGDFAPFTESMIYHEDCYNSSRFRCRGYDIWQDTDIVVKLLRGPRMLSDHLKEIAICHPFERPGHTQLYVPVSERAA